MCLNDDEIQNNNNEEKISLDVHDDNDDFSSIQLESSLSIITHLYERIR